MSADISGGAGSYTANIEDMRRALEVLARAVTDVGSATGAVGSVRADLANYPHPSRLSLPGLPLIDLMALSYLHATHERVDQMLVGPHSPQLCVREITEFAHALGQAIELYEQGEKEVAANVYNLEVARSAIATLTGFFGPSWLPLARQILKFLPPGMWQLLGADFMGLALDSMDLCVVVLWAVLTGKVSLPGLVVGNGKARQDLLRVVVQWGEQRGLANMADRLIAGRTMWPVPRFCELIVLQGSQSYTRTDMQMQRLTHLRPPSAPAASVADLARLIDMVQPSAGGHASAVAIERHVLADGTTTYIAAIPGTQDFNFNTDNINDLQSIGQSYLGQATPASIAVVHALVASGARPTDKIVLAGHSMGGMNAVNLANDPLVRSRFNIAGVVTFGSPVKQFASPPGIQTLHVEHVQDFVQMTDLGKPPAGPTRTTVSVDMAQVPQLEPFGFRSHDLQTYAVTSELFVDGSNHPSVAAFNAAVADVLGGNVVSSDLWVYQGDTSPAAVRNFPLAGVGGGPSVSAVIALDDQWRTMLPLSDQRPPPTPLTRFSEGGS